MQRFVRAQLQRLPSAVAKRNLATPSKPQHVRMTTPATRAFSMQVKPTFSNYPIYNEYSAMTITINRPLLKEGQHSRRLTQPGSFQMQFGEKSDPERMGYTWANPNDNTNTGKRMITMQIQDAGLLLADEYPISMKRKVYPTQFDEHGERVQVKESGYRELRVEEFVTTSGVKNGATSWYYKETNLDGTEGASIKVTVTKAQMAILKALIHGTIPHLLAWAQLAMPRLELEN